jgi:ankyrin repeat protein
MIERLRLAAITGDLPTLVDAIERGASIDARDRYGQTPIMLAAHHGCAMIVNELIARRANLDVTGKFGLSALMLAVIAGHVDIARALLAAGADTSLRATGRNAFAGRSARDLAEARGHGDLWRGPLDG